MQSSTSADSHSQSNIGPTQGISPSNEPAMPSEGHLTDSASIDGLSIPLRPQSERLFQDDQRTRRRQRPRAQARKKPLIGDAPISNAESSQARVATSTGKNGEKFNDIDSLPSSQYNSIKSSKTSLSRSNAISTGPSFRSGGSIRRKNSLNSPTLAFGNVDLQDENASKRLSEPRGARPNAQKGLVADEQCSGELREEETLEHYLHADASLANMSNDVLNAKVEGSLGEFADLAAEQSEEYSYHAMSDYSAVCDSAHDSSKDLSSPGTLNSSKETGHGYRGKGKAKEVLPRIDSEIINPQNKLLVLQKVENQYQGSEFLQEEQYERFNRGSSSAFQEEQYERFDSGSSSAMRSNNDSSTRCNTSDSRFDSATSEPAIQANGLPGNIGTVDLAQKFKSGSENRKRVQFHDDDSIFEGTSKQTDKFPTPPGHLNPRWSKALRPEHLFTDQSRIPTRSASDTGPPAVRYARRGKRVVSMPPTPSPAKIRDPLEGAISRWSSDSSEAPTIILPKNRFSSLRQAARRFSNIHATEQKKPSDKAGRRLSGLYYGRAPQPQSAPVWSPADSGKAALRGLGQKFQGKAKRIWSLGENKLRKFARKMMRQPGRRQEDPRSYLPRPRSAVIQAPAPAPEQAFAPYLDW